MLLRSKLILFETLKKYFSNHPGKVDGFKCWCRIIKKCAIFLGNPVPMSAQKITCK